MAIFELCRKNGYHHHQPQAAYQDHQHERSQVDRVVGSSREQPLHPPKITSLTASLNVARNTHGKAVSRKYQPAAIPQSLFGSLVSRPCRFAFLAAFRSLTLLAALYTGEYIQREQGES